MRLGKKKDYKDYLEHQTIIFFPEQIKVTDVFK